MKSEKIFAVAVALMAASSACAAAVDAMNADPNVVMTSLSARQRYPWNGKVDVDFAFTCTVPDAFAFVQFRATYVNAEGATVEVPMKTFEQITLPWCTTAGTYRVTWDSTADAPGLVVTNMKYRVTANMAKYMVIDLSSGKNGASWPISYYEDVPSFPGVEAGKWDDYHKTTNLVLRLVQPGEFKECWGDWSDDRRYYNIHTSILTRPYYLAVFELTQEQHYLMNGLYGYEATASMLYTGGNRKVRPSVDDYKRIRGSGLPSSDNINWPVTGSAVGANSLMNLIRQKTGSDFFDLPTDSEWEYACRCGGTASGFWNDASDAGINTATKLTTIADGNATLGTLGRYRYNGGMVKTWDDVGQTNIYTAAALSSDEALGTAVVGSYAPNAWGFYDMHGNVPEWCCCAMTRSWLSAVACTNDVGTTVAEWTQYQQRVYRGGGFDSPACQCAIPFRTGVREDRGRGIRLCWRFPIPAQGE